MNEEELKRLSDCEVLLCRYRNEIHEMKNLIGNYNAQIMPKYAICEQLENMNRVHGMDFGNLKSQIDSIFKEIERSKGRHAQIDNKLDEHNKLIDYHDNQIETAQKSHDESDIKHIKHEMNHDAILVKTDKQRDIISDIQTKMCISHEKLAKEIEILKKRIDNLYDLDKVRGENANTFQMHQYQIFDSFKIEIKKLQKEMQDQGNSLAKNIHCVDVSLRKQIENLPKPEKYEIPDISSMIQPLKDKIAVILDITDQNRLEPMIQKRQIAQILGRLDKLGV